MIFRILSNVFLHLFLLTVVSPSSIPNGCPRHIGMSQLLQYGPYCIQIRTHAADWQKARRECQYHKGDLVQIDDPQMQEAIVRKLKTMSTDLTGYWIGAESSVITGNWQWVSGNTNLMAAISIGGGDNPLLVYPGRDNQTCASDQLTGYSNWALGQGPGHHTNFMLENSCAAIFPDPQFQWRDYDCSRRLAAFICQYNIGTKTTPRIPHSSTNSSATFGETSTKTTTQTTSTPFTTTTTRPTTITTTNIPTSSTASTTSTLPSTTTTTTEIPTTTTTTEIPTTTTTTTTEIPTMTTTTTVPTTTTTTERTTRTTTTEEIYGVILGR